MLDRSFNLVNADDREWNLNLLLFADYIYFGCGSRGEIISDSLGVWMNV